MQHVAGLVFLLSVSGLVGQTFLAVKEITSCLERELQVETDCVRLARLSHLTRDVDRLQPLTACGLFREAQSSVFTSPEWSTLIGRDCRDLALIGRELYTSEIFS